MKLIVGLGNPGKEYEHTRHNVGEMICTYIGNFSGLQSTGFSVDSELQANIARIAVPHSDKIGVQEKVVLAIPSAYMNESGISVHRLISFYKIKPDDCLIIHDDLDIEFGRIKFQFDRSPAGHNGIRSVVEHIGTQSFWRMRIGIGGPIDQTPVDKFVVQRFNTEELKTIKNHLPELMGMVVSHILNPKVESVRYQIHEEDFFTTTK